MVIIRDGKQYQLTDGELLLAWSEQQQKHRIDEIRNLIDMHCEDVDSDIIDYILNDNDELSKIANIYFRYYDRLEVGDYEYDTIHEAINTYQNNRRLYQPRLEVVLVDDDGSAETDDVWQDWGVFDTEKEAEEVADALWKKVKNGDFDSRLQPAIEAGNVCHLNVCIEIINPFTWGIEDIYYDKDGED